MAVLRRVLSLISTVIGFLFFAILLIPLIGPAVYIEVGGKSAPATITEKRETIRMLTDSWSRNLLVATRFETPGIDEPVETTIRVNAATYDSLHVGDAVRLRYVLYPFLRDFGNIASARLESQPPFGSYTAIGGSFLTWFFVGAAICLGLGVAFAKRPRWWFGLPLFALVIGGALYIGSGWPSPAPAGPRATGSATVRNTREITRVWGGRRTQSEAAVQPYTIVELSFVPEGRTDPVVAVDMIDAGSVPELGENAVVPISYSVANPRWAQIAGANRTYYWKNLRTFGLIAVVVAAALLFSWLFRARSVRRRRGVLP